MIGLFPRLILGSVVVQLTNIHIYPYTQIRWCATVTYLIKISTASLYHRKISVFQNTRFLDKFAIIYIYHEEQCLYKSFISRKLIKNSSTNYLFWCLNWTLILIEIENKLFRLSTRSDQMSWHCKGGQNSQLVDLINMQRSCQSIIQAIVWDVFT